MSYRHPDIQHMWKMTARASTFIFGPLRVCNSRLPSVRCSHKPLEVQSRCYTRKRSAPTSTHSKEHASSRPIQRPTSRRRLYITLAIFGLTTSYLFFWPSSTTNHGTLNDTTFVPYTITTRVPLSPTSFVLSLTPKTPNPDPPYLLPGTDRWRHPLWSVEFKQPQVQISRHYTPLPPSARGDCKDGVLTFYIRAVGDGEMSRYLCRLREGDDVELRGPHVGFDVVQRLGAMKHIVFLAGGTGVVPGLQAAKVALDGYTDTKVLLLWAVRKREEIQGARSEGGKARAAAAAASWWEFRRGEDPSPTELPLGLENPSPVTKQLDEMKRQYGDRLTVNVAVDEEGTYFQAPNIQKAISAAYPGDKVPPGPASSEDTSCALHEQKLHQRISEFETRSPECSCVSPEGALPGRNLFIISGPDGFVAHYAGAKVWSGGQQTQGAVGGVLGEIQRKYPQLAREWLVLKL